jgi:exosome complex component RRP41
MNIQTNSHMTYNRRSLEIASAIKQTFEPVVQTSQFPRSQIDIYLQVLQHDGGKLTRCNILISCASSKMILVIGTLQACINAATMALIDAGIPMIDYVCASTAGCIEKQPVLGESLLQRHVIYTTPM